MHTNIDCNQMHTQLAVTAVPAMHMAEGKVGQLNYSNHASLMRFKIAVYLQSRTCKLNFIMFTSQ